MSISLCMIVKNEAHQLAACFDSARSWVDEWIVVDTGSTDETRAIAQSHNATVYSYNWNDDFAAARNESISHATGDWILVLDADERLNAAAIPQLNQAILSENTLVVNLVRHEVGATQSPYSLVSRLFRNHPALQFTHPYHAQIDESVLALVQHEPRWQIVELPDIAILHEGYRPDVIQQRQKAQMARASMESYLREHPDDPYECSKLGALYVQFEEVQAGIRVLKHGLAVLSSADAQTAAIKYELHYHLGIAYSRLQQPELALSHYRVATQQPILPPLKLGAYNNLGRLLKESGELAEAAIAFEACVAIAPDFALGFFNLGTTLRALNRLPEAIAQYQRAIQLQPDYADAHQNLGVALLKLGRTQDAQFAFKRAIALHMPERPEVAEGLRRELRRMGFEL